MISYMAHKGQSLSSQVLAKNFPFWKLTIQNLLVSILHSMVGYRFHCTVFHD